MEEEEAGLKKSSKPSPAPKVTRAQIQSLPKTTPAGKKDSRVEEELPELEENVNRLAIEEGAARNVEEAISVLG